jgi:hypothetical protein
MKYVAFCVSDDIYIPKCVVSLLSFNNYNPEFDLVIITKKPSDKHIELCNKYNIEVITINLDKYFYMRWDYPKECFYHFKGPELLYERGYDYSVFFDGDVYCNNPVNINWNEIEHIGGVGHKTCKLFIERIDDFKLIKTKFNIKNNKSFNRRHIQAGIIIYNNKTLTEFKYFKKASELYDKSIRYGCPRKGDDSLLAFIIGYYPNLKVKYLISHYNFRNRTDFRAYLTNQYHLINSCVFYHMIGIKPWIEKHEKERYPNYVYKYFVEKWRETMINRFSQLEIKTYYPQFYIKNPIPLSRIKYYWYEGTNYNFGDCITPYLVYKFCNIRNIKSVNPKHTSDIVLISTGSIMRLCNKNTIIWGSGIRDINQNIKKGIIRGVRGPLTRDRLIDIKCECPTNYGDPGLLLPSLYNPDIEKKYELGIVPHHSQYERVYELYRFNNTALVIDLRTNDIEYVIDQILSCKNIISSSLHGIVTAHAYNIPVRWIKFSKNGIRGDDTKFYDHYLSVGIKDVKYISAMEYRKITVKHLLTTIKPEKISFNVKKFLDSSFFDSKSGIKKYIRYIITKPDKFIT